jgi:biopolymer transport protein ExbD
MTNDKTQHKKKPVLHSHDATKPAAKGSMADINVTPMIDVLLVLLIIFMVVTPVAQRGMDIALPPADQDTEQQEDTSKKQVVMQIESSGAITVNKRPVSTKEELAALLRDTFQTRADKTIFVRAAGQVPYGDVVEAMDVAKGAGVERIGIISEAMLREAAARAAAGVGP